MLLTISINNSCAKDRRWLFQNAKVGIFRGRFKYLDTPCGGKIGIELLMSAYSQKIQFQVFNTRKFIFKLFGIFLALWSDLLSIFRKSLFFGLIRKSEVSLVISEKNCAKSKFFYSGQEYMLPGSFCCCCC